MIPVILQYHISDITKHVQFCDVTNQISNITKKDKKFHKIDYVISLNHSHLGYHQFEFVISQNLLSNIIICQIEFLISLNI